MQNSSQYQKKILRTADFMILNNFVFLFLYILKRKRQQKNIKTAKTNMHVFKSYIGIKIFKLWKLEFYNSF